MMRVADLRSGGRWASERGRGWQTDCHIPWQYAIAADARKSLGVRTPRGSKVLCPTYNPPSEPSEIQAGFSAAQSDRPPGGRSKHLCWNDSLRRNWYIMTLRIVCHMYLTQIVGMISWWGAHLLPRSEMTAKAQAVLVPTLNLTGMSAPGCHVRRERTRVLRHLLHRRTRFCRHIPG
jgi:hypothetical protein